MLWYKNDSNWLFFLSAGRRLRGKAFYYVGGKVFCEEDFLVSGQYITNIQCASTGVCGLKAFVVTSKCIELSLSAAFTFTQSRSLLFQDTHIFLYHLCISLYHHSCRVSHLNATHNLSGFNLHEKFRLETCDLVAQFPASNVADSYQLPPLGGTGQRSVIGEAALLWFIGWRGVCPVTPVQYDCMCFAIVGNFQTAYFNTVENGKCVNSCHTFCSQCQFMCCVFLGNPLCFCLLQVFPQLLLVPTARSSVRVYPRSPLWVKPHLIVVPPQALSCSIKKFILN